MTLNRRAVMGAALSAGGAALALRPVSAQAESHSSVSATGSYRYALGDMVVTAATDGFVTRPLQDGFVTNAELSDVQAALDAAFLPTDTLDIPFTPIVVQNGTDTILFDTGFADNGPPTTGMMAANLAASGIMPEDITKVVITHFHPDHIHGLKTKAGEQVFANAEVMVPANEWAFWTNGDNKANVPENRRGLFDLVAGKFDGIEVTQYNWEQEIITGITAIEAAGHTPGHTGFAFNSGDARMLLLADTTNHPALFVTNPDWSVAFDMDGEQAAKTRRKMLQLAASERMPITGFHFPFPAAGHIAKEGNGFRLVPVNWTPKI